MRELESIWLGEIPYFDALELQEATARSLRPDSQVGQILGLTHPLTITLGIRSEKSSDLKVSHMELEEKGVEVVQTGRGGQATLHNPGQLVIYPIVDLKVLGLGVRNYVCLLENVTTQFFHDLGIKVTRPRDEPGLYSKKGKLAFFGIQVKRGITFHGVSINVENNLEDFKLIRSCGLDSDKIDLLRGHEIQRSIRSLFDLWTQIFAEKISEAAPRKVRSDSGLTLKTRLITP